MNRGRIIVVIAVLVAAAIATWLIYGRTPRERLLSGYIEGQNLYLAAPVAGTVASISAVEGTRVTAGQTLFTIDPATLSRDPAVVEGLSTHVSPQERQAFFALEAVGVTDVVRPRVPEGYTYWDYKQLRFPRNEGMRIDFILGSSAFADAVTDASIHRNERKGTAPSDHVPVLVELARGGNDDDVPMIFG